MTPIVVACPVAHRDWIIRHWADHAIVACERAGLEPWFVVAAHPTDPTPAVLAGHIGTRFGLTVAPTDVVRDEDRRTWQPHRLEQITQARNDLLRAVRDLRPELMLSVDSDILLHPDALAAMVPLLDNADAAGSACFLSRAAKPRADGTPGAPSWNRPNCARLDRDRKMERLGWQANTTRRVDVLMAIKLMTPAAYQVDYRYDWQGEDIGWAIACAERGLRFAWTSNVVSKHVMDAHCKIHDPHDPTCERCVEPIGRFDPRCGY